MRRGDDAGVYIIAVARVIIESNKLFRRFLPVSYVSRDTIVIVKSTQIGRDDRNHYCASRDVYQTRTRPIVKRSQTL